MPMCNVFMYVYNVFVFCVCMCVCLCVDMCLTVFTSVWMKALNKKQHMLLEHGSFTKFATLI